MLEGKWHLVTTCQYSDWVEIDILLNTLTATVVEFTKPHFARFGIPDRLVTDNGPQFISNEYKQFVDEYGFEHVTSSPYWWQGNGKAEAAVKIVKRVYPKNKDIHLVLLDYRDTPPTRTRTLSRSKAHLLTHKGYPSYDTCASAA